MVWFIIFCCLLFVVFGFAISNYQSNKKCSENGVDIRAVEEKTEALSNLIKRLDTMHTVCAAFSGTALSRNSYEEKAIKNKIIEIIQLSMEIKRLLISDRDRLERFYYATRKFVEPLIYECVEFDSISLTEQDIENLDSICGR